MSQEDRTAPADMCLVCRRLAEPYKWLISAVDPSVVRGYYECGHEHDLGERALWWTHWRGDELIDRELGLEPDMAGGGTTWSTIPVGTAWSEELADLLPWLRPAVTSGGGFWKYGLHPGPIPEKLAASLRSAEDPEDPAAGSPRR